MGWGNCQALAADASAPHQRSGATLLLSPLQPGGSITVRAWSGWAHLFTPGCRWSWSGKRRSFS